MGKGVERKALERWQLDDAKRLRELFNSREPKVSQDTFGDTYKIGSQGVVSQYLIGHIPLNLTAAARFSKGLRCKMSEISPTLASLGDEIAASLGTETTGTLTDDELDLLEGYNNAPPEAQKVILSSVQPFLPKKRKGAGRR